MKQFSLQPLLQKLGLWWQKLQLRERWQKMDISGRIAHLFQWLKEKAATIVPTKAKAQEPTTRSTCGMWEWLRGLPWSKWKQALPGIRKKIGSVLASLAVVISAILCVSVIVQVLTNGYVQIGKVSLFRVVTGSMEPALPVGTLLVCTETDIDNIEVGDIICFRSRDPVIAGKIITHRVITVAQDERGQRILETKGDANLSADGEFVWQSNLVGRVNQYAKDGHIMTSFVNILTDKMGFLMLVLFPTLLIAGFILRSCINNMRHNIELALEAERQARELEAADAQTEALYSAEEYADMIEKIKQELLQEMEQGAEDHDEKTGEPSKTE